MSALAEAASAAPQAPGVYFFLGEDASLLYAGKAGNLRRRLQQHAGTPSGGRARRQRALLAAVHEVRWEVLESEGAAAAREADLIVALQPPYNASIRGEGQWVYLAVEPGGAPEVTRFGLTPTLEGRMGRVYGCFPHLGRGVTSQPAIACSDGYVALLRLLWATAPANAGRPFPSRITRSAPPEFATAVAPHLDTPLHAFLAGRSRRLLHDLSTAVEDLEPYLQPALRRDLESADGFYRAGPAAIRTLRLRHRLPPGPISRGTIVACLAAEVRAAIGEVRLGTPRTVASHR